MLQIVLKSYNYYDGNIDGDIGPVSKTALIKFQNNNDLDPDGILGPQTCLYLLNKNNIITNPIKVINTVTTTADVNKYSEEVENNQKILKSLGLYTGVIDGIDGPGTKRAVKDFQNKSGLVSDGVVGQKTKTALAKGEAAYVTVSSETEIVVNKPSASSALDLINYNPSLTCTAGYINNIDVWVPDPCFYPVFVYRFGKTAQVNSQNELDSYLQARWSLTKEKTYTSIGPVSTQNYTAGVNSPVNGLPMSPSANNSIVIGIKNDNNVRARPQSGPQSADAVVEVLVEDRKSVV